MVDSYISSFSASPTGPRVQMSLLDLKRADGLQRLDAESRGQRQKGDSVPRAALISSHSSASVTSSSAPPPATCARWSILSELCENLKEIPSIASEASKLSDFLTRKDGGIIRYQKGHPELDNMKGLGVFAPFVTDIADLERLGIAGESGNQGIQKDHEPGRQEYQASPSSIPSTEPSALQVGNAATNHESPWPTLVYDDLRQALPTEVFSTIVGAGVSDRAGRADVTQLLVTMDSVFNRLDRVVREAGSSRHFGHGTEAAIGPAAAVTGRHGQVSPASIVRRERFEKSHRAIRAPDAEEP